MLLLPIFVLLAQFNLSVIGTRWGCLGTHGTSWLQTIGNSRCSHTYCRSGTNRLGHGLSLVVTRTQPITKILRILMATMTKTSCRVLYLGSLLVGRLFLVYCSSPTARANIKKVRSASMPVPRKVIQSALIDLHHNETTINDKWLTLEAIRKLIYSRFDFSDGIDFTVGKLKRAVCTNVGSCPFAEASHFLFCYQIRI
jgi:hypothetical protein